MIEKNELKTLAKLSKLSFTEREEEQLRKELESILLFADQLQEASGQEDSPFQDSCDLREDEAVPCMGREELLSNAPSKENGFFTLPRRGEH